MVDGQNCNYQVEDYLHLHTYANFDVQPPSSPSHIHISHRIYSKLQNRVLVRLGEGQLVPCRETNQS